MNQNHSCFRLICKPEQSGKTFIMIKGINKFLYEEEEGNQTVNMIFCDNNLLLTKQTSKRVKDGIKLPDIDEPYVEFSSSKNKQNVKGNYPEVFVSILQGTRNVICCTNKKRVIDIKEIVKLCNDNFPSKYKFNIWLDEADKFIDSYIIKEFIPLIENNNNVDLFCLTATPQPIFKKFNDVCVIPIENTTQPDYHGWNDNIIECHDDDYAENTILFAQTIAVKIKTENRFLPGTKCYVPSDSTKISHYKMRDIFISMGVAVFVINGDGIELSLPNQPYNNNRYLINKTQELQEHILECYQKYKVYNLPCIITGSICVSRGNTIMNRDFIFDYAILSNCSNKETASQEAGRLKGNIKNLPNYKPPIVYTTSKFDKIARKYEETSREIARLAFNKDSIEPSRINKGEALNIVKNREWTLFTEEFYTLEDTNIFLRGHNCNCKDEKKIILNENGFIKSSTTKKLSVLNYNDVKEEMKSWCNTSTMDLKKTSSFASRTFICYKDIQDINSVVYIVRIVKRK